MAAYWNIAGLALNLAGVILLFRFGMPYRVPQINEGSLFADEPTSRDRETNQRYKIWGKIGLAAIVIGTASQAVATLIG